MQFVLTSILIYLVMALDLPRWAHKLFEKNPVKLLLERAQGSKGRSLSRGTGYRVHAN
jgi:hypothetical protein